MREVTEVLIQHEIQGELSCISWGIEFIAKLHDAVPPSEHPIQAAHMEGMGFGKDAIELLADLKIHAWEDSLEWAEFEKVAKEDAAAGFNLVFTLPSSIYLDPLRATFGSLRGFHACVAVMKGPNHYITKARSHPGIPLSVLVQKHYEFVRSVLGQTDYKIHCMRHRPI